MGYPTIGKFDVKFIERTLENVENFKGNNEFTHLLNSLVGLIFVPYEFKIKGKRTLKNNFLNKKVCDYEELSEIYSGETALQGESGEIFQQRKFFYIDKNGEQTIETTTVGDLVRLFRNAIAHQNITPVADGEKWKGIIVKNYRTMGDCNFEAFLTQKELRIFAKLIANEYIENAQ